MTLLAPLKPYFQTSSELCNFMHYLEYFKYLSVLELIQNIKNIKRVQYLLVHSVDQNLKTQEKEFKENMVS